MEKKFKRTTVTSALPYANGPVHIGHLAGVYVPADIYVRYLRLKKEDVIFIGGSDEHGVPITIRAKKEGVTPQDIVQKLITTPLRNSSVSCTIKAILSKKQVCSITTRKPRLSLPTAISQANVPTAMQKVPTVTNAKSAVRASAPQT